MSVDSELSLRIQWSSGGILPVLTRTDATGDDLAYLLRFACTPGDVLVLMHNGTELNPDLTLEKQQVHNNDIIEVYITHRNVKNSIDSDIRGLVLEAAKISDQHLAQREMRPIRHQFDTKSSSDDDYSYVGSRLVTDTSNIGTDPLPVFWKESD